MSAGLDEFGLTIKTLPVIKAELDASFRAEFGQNVKLDARSVNGIQNGIIAEQLADCHEALEDTYSASYRDFATGVHLDHVAGRLGVTRDEATKSRVQSVAIGTNGTIITAGSSYSDGLAGSPAWFVVADATIAGGVAAIEAEPEDTGPIQGLAGTLTVIGTPISGWTGVSNALDAVVGKDRQSDPSLRQEMLERRVAARSSKLEGVLGAVALLQGPAPDKFPGLVEVQAFENRSFGTDSYGNPPRSFEILVDAGADADLDAAIAQAIWGSKPAGMEAYGVGSSGVAVDGNGDNQTVPFSRAAEVDVYVVVEYEPNDAFPVDGEALIEAEILDFEPLLRIGREVEPFAIEQVIETPGIARLVTFLGFAANPTTSQVLTIGRRQRAALDSSRIEVRPMTS